MTTRCLRLWRSFSATTASMLTGWLVPAELILEVAADMGVGSVETICHDFKLDLPEGWDDYDDE